MTATISPDEAIGLEPGSPAAPRRGPRIPLILLGLFLVVGGGWALRTWIYGRSHVSTDNAQVDGHITPIAPKVGGFVNRVYVEENQPVQLGDTLVVLDSRDFRSRLLQAEADLAVARAMAGSNRRAGQMQAQVEASRANAAGAQATVVSAEASVRKAQSDLERARRLAATQVVSAQQLDAAEAAYAVASAQAEAARRQAGAATEQVAASIAALQGADARLASAEGALETARLQLGYTTILAPARGIVARRRVESGRAGPARADADDGGADRRRVGHGQPQGDADRGRVARRLRDVHGRRLPGTHVPRHRRERQPGHRRALRAAAARQRHRQLHQGGAADPGADRGGRATRPANTRSGPACRSTSRSAPAEPAVSSIALPLGGRQQRATEVYRARYLIAFAVTLASVLELVDTSIVNVAIPHMMGNLGATLEEIAWVSTGYIVANVIVLPLTGWLSRAASAGATTTPARSRSSRSPRSSAATQARSRAWCSGASCRASAAAR